MAEGNDPPPVDDTRDYLGVLLLGRTGQGKSTTGNKLLNAKAVKFVDAPRGLQTVRNVKD